MSLASFISLRISETWPVCPLLVTASTDLNKPIPIALVAGVGELEEEAFFNQLSQGSSPVPQHNCLVYDMDEEHFKVNIASDEAKKNETIQYLDIQHRGHRFLLTPQRKPWRTTVDMSSPMLTTRRWEELQPQFTSWLLFISKENIFN